jgi:hypothetical protein
MQRVNQYGFYNLGSTLARIKTVKAGDKDGDTFFHLAFCGYLLDSLIKRNEPIPLGVSRAACRDLVNSLREAWQQIQPEKGDGAITAAQISGLNYALDRFETILSAELQAVDVYFVSPKGIYSTPDLIERAENVLPEEIRKFVPEVVLRDLKEAGRCLAFDVPTAAGFHILRAIEAVIRQYYEILVGEKPKPKMRNWGAYIKILKTKNADEKVTASLNQIRELHRNPVLHPDETLTGDEATTLFGIAQSAILAMVSAMQKQKQPSLPGTEEITELKPKPNSPTPQ